VTGIRQDVWAQAFPLVVEEAKPADLTGAHLHPGLADDRQGPTIGLGARRHHPPIGGTAVAATGRLDNCTRAFPPMLQRAEGHTSSTPAASTGSWASVGARPDGI